MRIGKTRVLRTALYATVLATLVTAIILPRVAADNPLFRVRVLMAVPDNAGVDVWIDDVQLAANAQFKTVTAYAQRQDGDYELSVYPAGRKTQSAAYVYKRVVKFRSPKDYTVVVMGRQSDASIDASVEIDRNTLDGSTNAKVRFGNYIPGTSTLTLAVAVSNTILGNAKARETAEYVAITTGTYSLILNDGNGNLITRMDNVTLGPNTTVSVFAVGLSGGTPAPSLVVTTDAGTAPAQGAVAPTATTAPVVPVAPGALPPAPTPTSAASASLRQAFLPVPSVANTSAKVFYTATGHTLGGVFKTYWEEHGGLEQFGYPITEEYQEASLTDGKIYTTQYFERARFEYHPENKGTQYEVLQGLLGREMFKLLGVG